MATLNGMNMYDKKCHWLIPRGSLTVLGFDFGSGFSFHFASFFS